MEWDYGITGAASTMFNANGVELTFIDMRDGVTCSTILTPAQAIAATLGPCSDSCNCTNGERTDLAATAERETCAVTKECKCSVCGWQYPCRNYETYTTCDGRTGYRNSFRLYNECGTVNFCPNCGRRVVDQ